MSGRARGRARALTQLAIATMLALVVASARAQDRDADRVLDDVDLCPDVSEGVPTLFPGDGCPDVDADGDHVVDDYDVCPTERETVDGFQDADGCPDADGAAIRALAHRIRFDAGEHTLARGSAAVVRRLAAFLSAHAEIARAQIEGRADGGADEAANLALSQRRAEAVRDALVAAGVATTRLTAIGLGALPGDSPAIEAESQRCDVRVVPPTGAPAPLDTSAVAGRWQGARLLVLDVHELATQSGIRVQDGAPTWLGPPGAELDCYAGHAEGERYALHCRGVDVEATVVVRHLDADHLVGIVAARSHAGLVRTTWSGMRVPTFDQQAVVRMIQTHRSEIQACYERELAAHPTAAGRIAVRMTVERSGATEHVRVDDDSVAIPALAECVASVIDSFVFSPGPLRGSVTYTFPFVFEPLETEADAHAPTTETLTVSEASPFLRPDEIMVVVRAHQLDVRRCYEEALQSRPSLGGRIEIEWRIELDGSVRTSHVERTTMAAPDVEACVAREVLGWRFPAPRGGEVNVRFPFDFGPRAGASVSPAH